MHAVKTCWVDADACPVAIKEILFRAAERTRTRVTLVANQYLQVPRSKYIRFIQVPGGYDVADNEIARRCSEGDLVVTQDIPLADEVIGRGCLALSPRGELYTYDNIKPRLNMRDFMDTLRSSGVQTGGPPPLSASEKQAFSRHLEKWLPRQG